jgi:light-harvesting protein B-800-850 alpha chain
MNEGKIWTVVKPSTGVPLFLGTIVVMVFTVHYAILSHTTWFSAYWQGGAKAPGMASTAPMIETAPAAATPTAAPVSATP